MTRERMDREEIARSLQQLAGGASYEIGAGFNMPKIAADCAAAAASIDEGTEVFITDRSTQPNSKDHDREQSIRQAASLTALGLRPVPHIAARRVQSQTQLTDLAAAFRAAGVRKFLLIAGDPRQPLGPYEKPMDLMATGLFDDAGIEGLYFAGHPYGNPNCNARQTAAELKAKNAYAAIYPDKDIQLLTQPIYDSRVLFNWLSSLERADNKLPVRVGVALGDLKTKAMMARALFVNDRPRWEQAKGWAKISRLALQNIGNIRDVKQDVPARFLTDIASARVTAKGHPAEQIGGIHYFAGIASPQFRQAAAVNTKLRQGDFSLSSNTRRFVLR